MKSNQTIAVLEDDPGLQFVYEEVLGIRYELVISDSISGLDQILEKKIVLLIADIRLKDGLFTDYLSNNKNLERLKQTPFVIVSSVDDLDALRWCFEQGAIDYFVKPFSKDELIVKVDRIINRKPKGMKADRILSTASTQIQIDQVALTASCNGATSEAFTLKEYQILHALSESNTQVVTRKKLIKQLWGDLAISNKALDVHLFNLRRKLRPLKLEVHYQQNRNGYQIIPRGSKSPYTLDDRVV